MLPAVLWPVNNGGAPPSLCRVAVVGAIVAIFSVLVGSVACDTSFTTVAFSLLSDSLNFWPSATARANTRGLVREELVFGSAAPDQEELDLLARMPSGPCGLLKVLVAALMENSRRLWKLSEVDGDAPTALEPGAVALPTLSPIDELRILVEQSLLLVALALKLFGFLLAGLVPLHLLAYWFLTQPGGLPFQFSIVSQIFGQVLAPLDRLLLPLLEFVNQRAQVLGVTQGDIPDEDWRGPDISQCAKRVLLGLLLLNIILSIATLAALSLLVLTIRASGIFAQ